MYDDIQVTSTNAVVMETEVEGGERKGEGQALSVLAGGGGLHSFVATALESLGYPLTGTKP